MSNGPHLPQKVEGGRGFHESILIRCRNHQRTYGRGTLCRAQARECSELLHALVVPYAPDYKSFSRFADYGRR